MDFIEALTDKGLTDAVRDIDTTLARAEVYEAMARSPLGEPLAMEMERRLKHIRSMYANIDTTSDSAKVALAATQSAECEVQGWLTRLQGSVALIEQLNTDRNQLLELAQARKEYRAKRPRQFLPGSHKKETSNG